jgi:hypothetical protein
MTKDKAADFKRLAVSRTNKALSTIRLVGNLSGSGYESNPDQIAAIFGALRTSLDEAEARFSGTAKTDTFEL